MHISEIFHSLQGEGKDIGLPTSFIRTTGCNLRCEWCDTRYAWEGGKKMSIREIKDKIKDFDCQRLCITGGEPLLQDDLIELIDSLLPKYKINVETNGSLDISELIERDLRVSMDYKTPSSGMTDKMKNENLDILRKKDQLKFVISDQRDYDYSLEFIKREALQCEIIMQPTKNWNLRDLANSVLGDEIDVRVLPQLHKIIWDDEISRR